MNNIKLIAIEELQHHPDNPRKDFGDLTELAESIKANGIMQNLTVVPSDDGTGLYDVIIGNRRLEAAKLAGLDELPCAVVELSPQEQMATMLAENMQREDLTILEQAQGFQYMLDLGETAQSIAEKTGFTARTVRRRVKLLELDKEGLEKAFKRQISLDDIDKINSIEDVAERNKLLDYAGTGNFNWAFNSAQRHQKELVLFDKVRVLMETTGLEEVEANTQWGANATKQYVNRINLECKTDEDLQNKIDNAVKAFGEKSDSYAFEGFGMYFLIDKKDEKPKAADNKKYEKENAQRKKNADKLNEAAANAFELRYDFIQSYTKTQAKKHYKVILAMLARAAVEIEDAAWNCDIYDYDSGVFEELSEIDTKDQQECETALSKIVNDAPEKMLLNYVYTLFGDNNDNGYMGWNYIHGCGLYDSYDNNPGLDLLYKFLEDLGYEMSDDEKSLQDGTHELFYKPDTEGDSDGE